jgi:hypothetical protein
MKSKTKNETIIQVSLSLNQVGRSSSEELKQMKEKRIRKLNYMVPC